MLNLNVPHAWDLHPGYYVPVVPQPTFSPQTISAQRAPTRETQSVVSLSSAPSRTPVIMGNPHIAKTPTAATAPQQNFHFQPDHAPKQSHKIAALSMDAETAIEDAPFVELGRHALAQNWCCVKISNVGFPFAFIILSCQRINSYVDTLQCHGRKYIGIPGEKCKNRS